MCPYKEHKGEILTGEVVIMESNIEVNTESVMHLDNTVHSAADGGCFAGM